MFQVKDLTGMRFGKLTVAALTEKREARYSVWHCKCDCGKECDVDSKRLQRGTITDCGCDVKRRSTTPLDLTGERYGSLTVLERAENKGSRTAWRCRCDCGKETVVCTHDLRAGHTKSCGCKSRSSFYYRDLTGQRFGRLTVLEKTDQRNYKGSVLWLCHCDCGNDVTHSEDALMHNRIKSCGCYRKTEICQKINEKLHRIEGTCIERLNVQKPRSDNMSGHVGIHKINDNRYRAMIGFQGKRYYLGTFPTLEDAIDARRRGEQMHVDFLDRYYQTYAENIPE